MKANINNQEVADASLSEPHFEDEETLLTARPVVPLASVKVDEVRGRRRAFGLAIASSLLVGFLSATVIYRLRSQRSPEEVINASVPGATGSTAGPTVTPTVEADKALKTGVGITAESGSLPANAAPKATQAAVVRVPNTANAKKTTMRKPEASFQANTEPEEQSSRASRREARRAARREARERRESPKGAWRIREIFEGSPRP